MVVKDLGSRSSFRLLFFGSDDALEILNQAPNASNPTLGGDIGFHTSFWRAQARYESHLGESTDIHLTAAYGHVIVDAGVGTNAIRSTLQPISARAELSQKVIRGLTINAGLDILFEPDQLAFQLPPPRAPGVPAGGPGAIPVRSSDEGSFFQPAGYVELEVVPRPGTRIVPGLRVDHDNSGNDWDVAPRLSRSRLAGGRALSPHVR